MAAGSLLSATRKSTRLVRLDREPRRGDDVADHASGLLEHGRESSRRSGAREDHGNVLRQDHLDELAEQVMPAGPQADQGQVDGEGIVRLRTNGTDLRPQDLRSMVAERGRRARPQR